MQPHLTHSSPTQPTPSSCNHTLLTAHPHSPHHHHATTRSLTAHPHSPHHHHAATSSLLAHPHSPHHHHVVVPPSQLTRITHMHPMAAIATTHSLTAHPHSPHHHPCNPHPPHGHYTAAHVNHFQPWLHCMNLPWRKVQSLGFVGMRWQQKSLFLGSKR